MASNVESGYYWEGYAAGIHGKPWTSVPYTPGTRSFHQWQEGRNDGHKARILQRHGQGVRKSVHAHGGDYHTH
jgi:ribosome modulation factor